MLARSNLNNIESKIYEALINSEIIHEDFMTIINEEKKYWEIKKTLEWRSDTEKIDLIEEGKKRHWWGY